MSHQERYQREWEQKNLGKKNYGCLVYAFLLLGLWCWGMYAAAMAIFRAVFG